MTEDAAQTGRRRGTITILVLLAAMMQTLDTTIVNVALPYVQGSVATSPDQITWVLTSYITASAIMTLKRHNCSPVHFCTGGLWALGSNVLNGRSLVHPAPRSLSANRRRAGPGISVPSAISGSRNGGFGQTADSPR